MIRALAASLFCGVAGLAAPVNAATLTGLSPGGFVIVDGTSNTIQFGENTRTTVCTQNATVTPADGSSNTILFGETGGFTLIGGSFVPFGPVRDIADGTSNTILLGEIASGSFCIFDGKVGETVVGGNNGGSGSIIDVGAIDVCFSSINRFQSVDGSSNTVFFNEAWCATDLVISTDVVIDPTRPVPVPAALLLGVTGLAMLAGLNGARRRRTAGDPAEA